MRGSRSTLLPYKILEGSRDHYGWLQHEKILVRLFNGKFARLNSFKKRGRVALHSIVRKPKL